MGCGKSKETTKTEKLNVPKEKLTELRSDVSGNKKALLIGLNYIDGFSERFFKLDGCINDTKNMKKVLVDKFGFSDSPDKMVVMNDDLPANDPNRPKKDAVLAKMKWLVEGAKSGDSLFFMFSGHSFYKFDKSGDEIDGRDEFIIVEDFHRISDDDINKILVKELPQGVRLTAIFDCCFSGTMLDLPFTYNIDGQIEDLVTLQKKPSPYELVQIGYHAMIGNKNARRMIKSHDQVNREAEKYLVENPPVGDVICFSASREIEKATDAEYQGKAGGAMTTAFIRALDFNAQLTYIELLAACRNWMKGSFDQIPQLQAGYHLDLGKEVFKM